MAASFDFNLTSREMIIYTGNPTNTPRGFHVETSFPRRFNMESTWCVCR